MLLLTPTTIKRSLALVGTMLNRTARAYRDNSVIPSLRLSSAGRSSAAVAPGGG